MVTGRGKVKQKETEKTENKKPENFGSVYSVFSCCVFLFLGRAGQTACIVSEGGDECKNLSERPASFPRGDLPAGSAILSSLWPTRFWYNQSDRIRFSFSKEDERCKPFAFRMNIGAKSGGRW